MSDKASKDRLVEIKGKQYLAAPLGLMDLDIAEDYALKQYKKRKIQTYTDNAEEMEGLYTKEELRQKVEELSNMEAEDLPKKKMPIPVLDKDGEVVMVPQTEKDPASDEMVETGFMVPKMKIVEIDYAGWWLANSIKGKVLSIWLSLRQHNPEITLEEADEMFKQDTEYMEAELEEVAQMIGKISQPSVGPTKND